MTESRVAKRPARAALLVAALATVLTAFPAVADDHQPPQVIFRYGQRQQVGPTSTGTWASPSPPPPSAQPGAFCGVFTWDPAPNPYPSALRVPGGDVTAKIVFQKTHRPESLVIRGWTHVDENGERRGGRRIGHTLRPVDEGGQVVAWVADVEFTLRRHLYLDVSAEWTDQEGMGCAGQRQSATWNFHLRARRR